MHGTTLHGIQHTEDKYRMTPVSYYNEISPFNDVLEILDTGGPQKIGVLGLGVGVMTCFKKDGRNFDYFEIDPQVVEIAENPEYFTFLSECDSPYTVTLGDGRLTMAEKPDDHYDVIMLDAFSSDNIPIHIITVEALEMYMRKLKEDGMLIVHISNRHLDLEPVLANAAEHLGVDAYARISEQRRPEGTPLVYFSAHCAVLTRDKDVIQQLESKGWTPAMKRKGVRLWTDQYSNIISVLGNRIGNQRYKKFTKAEDGSKD